MFSFRIDSPVYSKLLSRKIVGRRMSCSSQSRRVLGMAPVVLNAGSVWAASSGTTASPHEYFDRTAISTDKGSSGCSSERLGQKLVDDFSAHIRKPEGPALIPECQLRVIESQQMQNSRL